MGVLEDKTAIITGADSGIGRATAIEFAREGADVMVVFHTDADGADDTKQQVEALGRRAVVTQGDVGQEDDVERFFREAEAAFGTIDIVMNNAGVDGSGTKVAELEIDDFERSLRTNLFGPVLMCKHFVRHFAGRGQVSGGRILNVTSVHEEIPRAGTADYDCAKGALRNLTRTLALEVAEQGITVNNIAPGMVLTPFNQQAIDDPKVLEEQTKSIPMKRAADPAEIGRLAVFLASSDADYVTGSSYVMDGGLMQNQGQGA
jgi:glucose 1-dehydrogenase